MSTAPQRITHTATGSAKASEPSLGLDTPAGFRLVRVERVWVVVRDDPPQRSYFAILQPESAEMADRLGYQRGRLKHLKTFEKEGSNILTHFMVWRPKDMIAAANQN